MHIDFWWYRVEYRESWDVENRLRIAYVLAPEDASSDQIKMAMWRQFQLPISTDAFVQIERFAPVEKTVVSDSEVK